MDAAERRFRSCTNRFKRDLTRIISRSIDGMVREALKESARQAALAAKLEKQAAAAAERAERAARKAAEQQARAEAREARRNAAKAARAELAAARAAARALARMNRLGQQLELDLGGGRSPTSGRVRVRADSLLGAELADNPAAAGERSTLPSPGAAPPKQPSERPLFVHKRARDGQIHALRRVRESGVTPAPAETKPDAESRERP